MEFDFGKKFKELRAGREVTQETLAQHLQISPQAVSKWERGEGYPDIMLLPRIAAFFDVTVDELLGTTEEVKREKIKKWREESKKLGHAGKVEENLSLWESAYREYPKDPDVINAYTYTLWQDFNDHFGEDAEKSRIAGEKIISLAKEILERSNDCRIRDSAAQRLVLTFSKLEDKENAVKYANMQAGLVTCREELLKIALTGDELVVHCQAYTQKLVDRIAMSIEAIEAQKPTEVRIQTTKYVIGLYKGLHPNGDYGFYNCRIGSYYGKLSRLYTIAGDKEKCFEALQKAFDYAKAYDEYHVRTEPYAHTSPLLDKLVADPASTSKNYTENECSLLLGWLSNSVYDPYRNDPEFISIREQIESKAK